jgi:hypothetical protein
MREIFTPDAPYIPAGAQASLPACEWVLPASATSRRNAFTVRKALPAGMPDCLEVSILYLDEGIERCTAAIYSGHAYVVHYEFKPR